MEASPSPGGSGGNIDGPAARGRVMLGRFSRSFSALAGSRRVISNGDAPTRVVWSEVLAKLLTENSRNRALKEEAYVNTSLYCLPNTSHFREALINLEQWPPLNNFILFAILLNCVFLTFEDPVCQCAGGRSQSTCTQNEIFKRTLFVGAYWEKESPLALWHSEVSAVSIDCRWQESTEQVLWIGEIAFTAIFLVEMIIKIIARGFFMHKHAYLRDTLNWLDFIVVISGTISVLSDIMDLPKNSVSQFLRALRVLRPLRTMTRLKGMKPLMRTLVQAIRGLTNVVLLLIFGFILFGIFGLDILKGGLRGRCYFDPVNNNFTSATYSMLISQQTPFLLQDSGICAPAGWVFSEGNILGGVGCDDTPIDGVPYKVVCSRKKWCQHQTRILDDLAWGEWCRFDYNGNSFDLGAGWFSYDNFLGAFFCIFQTLTNEGWVDLMYSFGEGVSLWGSRGFHFLWVVLGSLIVIQLVLGMLSISYTMARDEDEHKMEREALNVDAILMEWDRQAYMPNLASTTSTSEWQSPSRIHGGYSHYQIHPLTMTKDTEPNGNSRLLALWKGFRSKVRGAVTSSVFQNIITLSIIVNTMNMMCFTWHDQLYYEGQICKRRCALDPHLPASATSDCSGPLFNHTYQSDGHRGGERPRQDKFCFLRNDAKHEFPSWSRFKGAKCSSYSREECDRQVEVGAGCWWKDGSCQLGLYSALEFANIAMLTASPDGESRDLMPSGLSVQASLRHFCGESPVDFEELCAGYDYNLIEISVYVNDVLNWIFIIEMISKLIGLGPREYFDDSFNSLDFFIVMASIFEMLQIVKADVSVFRTLRLTRLIKLMRSMTEVQKILRALIIALGSMKPLLIVLVIFIFMMSALMMTMFANSFRFTKSDWPRSNFDSFFMSERGHGSFTTIFQMLTTENWNTIMYNCIRTSEWSGETWQDAMMALPSICIVLVGNYIFINLFISILLEGFEEGAENEQEDEPKQTLSSRSSKILAFARRLSGKASDKVAPSSLPPSNTKRRLNLVPVQQNFQENEDLEDCEESLDDEDPQMELIGYLGLPVLYPGANSFFIFSTQNPLRKLAGSICQHPFFEDGLVLSCILITTVLLLFENPVWSVTQEWCPRPPAFLDCSGLPAGHERINCAAEKSHPDFGRVWKPCDDPDPSSHPPCCAHSYAYDIFSALDKFFSMVFLVEMILKMVALGLVLHPNSYLRNSWNIMDCFISVLGALSAYGENDDFKGLKVLRVVRALRPLRVIRRHPNLRVAVLGLISSVPAIINVLPLLMFWYAIWAMLGVSIFKGSLYSCYNPNEQSFYGVASSQGGPLWEPSMSLAGPESVPTIIECVAAGGGDTVWKQKPYSFNNFFAGFLTLWEMSTTEGWLDVMAALTDSAGGYPGVTPLPNLNPFWPTMYCMCHIFFGSFIFMNVIVSKVINNYMRVKNENGKSLFITKEQQEWKTTRMMIMRMKPMQRTEGPDNEFRRKMFRFQEHPLFDNFITMCIMLNIFSMMVNSLEYEAIDCFTANMFWVNLVFALIFLVEMLIKMIALGPRWYFIDSWNILDFIIVIFSILIVAVDVQAQEYKCGEKVESTLSFLRVIRALRIMRVLRLIRRLKDLRNMLATFYISLPSVINFGALTLLVLSIFSVLGMWLFFNVNLYQDAGEFMDENVSYAHFGTAFFSLFRQTTGEAWNGIMYYCSETDPYLGCASTNSGFLYQGCASHQLVGIAYHLAWNVFGCYAMMQLFTAVILENFIEVTTEESQKIDQDKLNEFVEVWTKLDPSADEKIHVDLLPELITQLSAPLGLKDRPVTSALLMEVIKDLHIPIRRNNCVGYKDTFLACVKRTILKLEDDQITDNDANEDAIHGRDAHQTGVSAKGTTAAEDFAARAVQKAYREWREVRIQNNKGLRSNWRPDEDDIL